MERADRASRSAFQSDPPTAGPRGFIRHRRFPSEAAQSSRTIWIPILCDFCRLPVTITFPEGTSAAPCPKCRRLVDFEEEWDAFTASEPVALRPTGLNAPRLVLHARARASNPRRRASQLRLVTMGETTRRASRRSARPQTVSASFIIRSSVLRFGGRAAPREPDQPPPLGWQPPARQRRRPMARETLLARR